MTSDEIDWDDVEAKRDRLGIHIDDLKNELKRARFALDALPKRLRGRQRGTRVLKASVLHNKYATIRAFDMIQKWRHVERKHGREIKRENELPPDGAGGPRSKIIEAACAKWPEASPEEVRTRISRLNADPANRNEYGGYLYRVRDPEWLDRSDDYLDV